MKILTVTTSTLVIFHYHFLICCADSTSDNEYTILDLENVVGYGEDCSNEGPFCDVRLHLSCDQVEEICVCDDKNGYVHVGNLEIIPTLFEEDDEEEGTKQKAICMKSSDLEYKMDRLLNITKKIKDFADIMKKYQKYLPKKYQDLLKDEVS